MKRLLFILMLVSLVLITCKQPTAPYIHAFYPREYPRDYPDRIED